MRSFQVQPPSGKYDLGTCGLAMNLDLANFLNPGVINMGIMVVTARKEPFPQDKVFLIKSNYSAYETNILDPRAQTNFSYSPSLNVTKAFYWHFYIISIIKLFLLVLLYNHY